MSKTILKLIKKNKANTFKVHYDPKCKMYEVFLNNESIYSGNRWDFHPGCYGGWCQEIGDFSSPHSMISRMIATYKIPNTEIKEKTMGYTDNGNWR